MEVRPREILIFETDDGRAPFTEWMNRIADNPKLYAVIMNRLDRVERGLFGDCKPVGEGISELRIDYGPGFRIYFGQDGPDIVVLLAGGDKSSQDADISTAKRYWKAYNA